MSIIKKSSFEKLEKLKILELTSPDYYQNNIDWLMDMLEWIDYGKSVENYTGLIEYQKFIKKFYNEKK